MKILKAASSGTLESSDIIVTIEPNEGKGIEIELTSSVMQQFGRIIKKTIQTTLEELGVEDAHVSAVDKGALDCTVRARTTTAAHRAAERTDYEWRVKK